LICESGAWGRGGEAGGGRGDGSCFACFCAVKQGTGAPPRWEAAAWLRWHPVAKEAAALSGE
jgi:ferredoxin